MCPDRRMLGLYLTATLLTGVAAPLPAQDPAGSPKTELSDECKAKVAALGKKLDQDCKDATKDLPQIFARHRALATNKKALLEKRDALFKQYGTGFTGDHGEEKRAVQKELDEVLAGLKQGLDRQREIDGRVKTLQRVWSKERRELEANCK